MISRLHPRKTAVTKMKPIPKWSKINAKQFATKPCKVVYVTKHVRKQIHVEE